MMKHIEPTNEEIADTLERIADLLETQDANPHRVRAYRNGADRVRSTRQSLAQMVRRGDGESLRQLPDIGQGLSRVISRIVQTGQSDVLERLNGESSAERAFARIPGIGEKLARRIAEQLQINTLEELEQAAHDGRLATVEGFGPRRIQSVQDSLASMLSRAARRRARKRGRSSGQDAAPQPEVGLLLRIDALYRRKAEASQLPTIAPRRFNPGRKAWLPIMHVANDGWEYTVLYSNTAQAHELNKTHDWVVIYYEHDSREDQATVVTATSGPLRGKRVVRGREAECEQYYAQQSAHAGEG